MSKKKNADYGTDEDLGGDQVLAGDQADQAGDTMTELLLRLWQLVHQARRHVRPEMLSWHQSVRNLEPLLTHLVTAQHRRKM